MHTRFSTTTILNVPGMAVLRPLRTLFVDAGRLLEARLRAVLSSRDGKANWRKFLRPGRWMLWHNGCDVSRTHWNPAGPAGTALPLARRRDHPPGGIFRRGVRICGDPVGGFPGSTAHL